jgi:hypothetical protein
MEELYWAAGFFDGEGHACVNKRVRKGGWTYYCPKVTISQIDPYVLKRFRAAVGSGYVSGPYERPHPVHKRSPIWTFWVEGEAAREVMAKLRSLLSPIKVAQIDDATKKHDDSKVDRQIAIENRQWNGYGIEDIRRLYTEQRQSLKEVSKRLGMSHGNLHRLMVKNSIPRRTSTEILHEGWATGKYRDRKNPWDTRRRNASTDVRNNQE